MQRVVVVEPPRLVVSLTEAKAHLKVDGIYEDALIAAYLAAAIGHVDGPDGWLGRALGVQTLEAAFDGFPSDRFGLPCPPMIDLLSIRYEDAGGEWRDLDPSAYELRGDEIGSAWGKSWPATRSYRGSGQSVRVRYRAGYEHLPPALRVAILLMVDDLYRNRGNVSVAKVNEVPMPATSAMLLQPYRVYV